MKFVEKANIWLPDGDPTSWVTRDGLTIGGLPAYQFDRIEAAVRRCKRGRIAIDGGAHVGLWSIHLAQVFEQVIAFEPVPDNTACFRRNVMHPNVTLYNHALGKGNEHSAMMGTKDSKKSVSWAIGDTGTLRVPVLPLDDMGLGQVDLIKLDVEGHELEALEGSIITIQRCKPVIVIEEKHDPDFKASALLTELGMYMVQQLKHDRIFTWEPEEAT